MSKRGMKRKDTKDDKPFDSRGSKNWPEHIGKFLRLIHIFFPPKIMIYYQAVGNFLLKTYSF